jgi:NAD(P)-dependent dehydrogenase (short-subunit alcohol dehydrogenase family)
MKGIAGKLTMITGGARGIGFSIAKRFAETGSNLIIADIDEQQAQASKKELEAMGVSCAAYRLDVSDVQQIKAFFATIKEEHGRLDILVNNAGIQIRNPSLDFLEKDWDTLMGINLKAVFFCSQQAAQLMKEGGGVIVNISSGTSTQTTPGRAPYVISKAGVNALTAVLAAEWADLKIRVNAVAPGWILTDMVKEGMKLGVVSNEQLMAAIPFKRLAAAEEIADSVVYLASENASYVTGQTLFVDGGWSVLGLPQGYL